MAARREASPAAQAPGVFLSANENLSAGRLLLEVALQTKDRTALDQHLRVHGTVRLMAGGAAFAHGFMLEHKRPALRDVAFAAGFLFGAQGSSAANHRLAFVRVMTVAATDSWPPSDRVGMRAFQNRMSVRQTELPPFIQVALKAGFG